MELVLSREYLHNGLQNIPIELQELIIELNQSENVYPEEIAELFQNIIRDFKAIIEDKLSETSIPENFSTSQSLIDHISNIKKELDNRKTKFEKNILKYSDFRTNEAKKIINKIIEILNEFLIKAKKEKMGYLFKEDNKLIELKKITPLDLLEVLKRLSISSWITVVTSVIGLISGFIAYCKF